MSQHNASGSPAAAHAAPTQSESMLSHRSGEISDASDAETEFESESITDINDTDSHSHHEWESVSMLVPMSVHSVYSMAVGVGNVVIYCMAIYDVYGKRGFTILCSLGVLVIALIVLHSGMTAMFWFFESRTHEGLMGAWSMLFAVFNAELECAAFINPTYCPKHSALRNALLPGAARYVAWGWFSVALLPRLALPIEWQKHFFPILSLLASVPLTFLSMFIMLSRLCFHKSYALVGFAALMNVATTALMTEMIEFVRTGDGTGVRVLLCPFVVYAACRGLAIAAVWDRWCSLTMVLLVCAVLPALAATDVPEVICSTSEMYSSSRACVSTASSGDIPDEGNSLQVLKQFCRTWRGIMLLFVVSSTVSLVVYGPLWAGARGCEPTSGMAAWEDALGWSGQAFLPFDIGNIEQSRWLILSMAGLTWLTGVSSIIVDACKHSVQWQGYACFGLLPVDRHFRCLTMLKIGMVLVKVGMLLFTLTHSSRPKLSVVLQLSSITLSSAMPSWSIIRLATAARDHLSEFQGTFRSPRLLWCTCITSVLLWHITNTAVVFSAVLARSGTPSSLRPQRLSWFAVLLQTGSLWVYAANELVLTVSSKLSCPRVFAAIHSTRGVKALLTLAAVNTPMVMLWKALVWISFCGHLDVGFREAFAHWETWLACVVSAAHVVLTVVAYVSIG